MFVTTDGLVELLVIEHLDLTRCLWAKFLLQTGLFGDVGGQTIYISGALVIHWGITLSIEPFQRGETLNAVSFSNVSVGIGIDFGDSNLVLCVGELVGEFFVNRGEGLAMSCILVSFLDDGRSLGVHTTPIGVELHKSRFSRLENDIVKVVWS